MSTSVFAYGWWAKVPRIVHRDGVQSLRYGLARAILDCPYTVEEVAGRIDRPASWLRRRLESSRTTVREMGRILYGTGRRLEFTLVPHAA